MPIAIIVFMPIETCTWAFPLLTIGTKYNSVLVLFFFKAHCNFPQ